MIQNEEKSKEQLQAEKLLAQAKARMQEANRKACLIWVGIIIVIYSIARL